MYVPGGYTILPDDRIVTSDVKPIQYVVTSVVIAYKLPGVVDHYEVMVKLPNIRCLNYLNNSGKVKI